MDDLMGWLPDHKCGLYLEHNPHRDMYESVEMFYEPEDFVSEEEWKKAVESDNVWRLHWYPETPIGSHIIIASSLSALRSALDKTSK